jgi:hypothetical protein
MNRIAVNHINHFASHYGHAWACESDFEDLYPVAVEATADAEQAAIVATLAAMDVAAKAAQNPHLPVGIKAEDAFAASWDGSRVMGYHHRTTTRRLTATVAESGLVTLVVWRAIPSSLHGLPVLAVMGDLSAPHITWHPVMASVAAALRHWRALAEGVAAFEQADIDTVFRRLAPQEVIAEHDAALAAAAAE